MQRIGPRVRAVRRKRGQSVAAVASAVDISARYLEMIEAGERDARNEVLYAIAAVLGVLPGVFHDDEMLERALRELEQTVNA